MPYRNAEQQRQALIQWRIDHPDYFKGKVVNKVPRKHRVIINYPPSYIIYDKHCHQIIHTDLTELNEELLLSISQDNKDKIISYGSAWYKDGLKITWKQVREL